MAEDDVANSLVAALVDGGHHVDDGRLTLDHGAAYKKLREYQLSDPHGYLLLLVEAAWLAAVNLEDAEVRIDLGNPTVVEFSGLALDGESLRDLFPAVLGISPQLNGEALRRARILQLLALAANHALALGPKQISIEVSDATGATKILRIEPRARLTLTPGMPLEPGMVRFSVRKRGFVLSRIAAERQLRRCCYTRLGIRLDGMLISRRQDVPLFDEVEPNSGKPAKAPVTLYGREIGVVGYARDPKVPVATRIINRGITHIDPDLNIEDLQVQVEVDLPVDLSRESLVRGPELAAVRTAILAARSRVAEPSRVVRERKEAARERELRWAFVVVCIVAIAGIMAAAFESYSTSNRWRNSDEGNSLQR